MEGVQLRGSQGFWQLQVLSGVGGWGSRKCGALEGMAASVGHYAPVFLPGDPRQRSLAGHRLQGHRESDTTEEPLSA